MNIEQEIDACITKSKKGYRDWYVSTATDPSERLFEGHNVNKKGGEWIYLSAGSVIGASDIEKAFLKKGCKGGPCEGDNPHFVYAYQMTPTTHGSKS